MDYSTIKVNEIYSEGGDFIELTNVGPAAVDVSDWVSGASKNAVLRYEPGTSMNATDEWSLNALLPVLGANLGLEGITWIPDSYLTEGGFVDQGTSAAYDPDDYAHHGDGLVATVDPRLLTNAGPAGAMDVAWEPETERLWVLCDDSCDGVTVSMELDAEGAFAVAHGYDRPLCAVGHGAVHGDPAGAGADRGAEPRKASRPGGSGSPSVASTARSRQS